MKIKSVFGKEYEVELTINTYLNGCLYVGLTMQDEGYVEPYGNITVNLPQTPAPDYCGFVDVNNMPTIVDFLEKYDLGTPTSIIMPSGYCTYPLYQFNVDKLRELCPEGMAIYEESLKGAIEQPEEDNEFVNLADMIDLDI